MKSFAEVCLGILLINITVLPVFSSNQCYKCSSIPDLGSSDTCRDPFDKAENKDNTIVCEGACQKIKYREDKQQVVIRQCSEISVVAAECKDGSHDNQKATICFCSGSLCNAASKRQYTLGIILPLAILLLLY